MKRYSEGIALLVIMLVVFAIGCELRADSSSGSYPILEQALIDAALNEDVATVKTLVNAGVDVNTQNKDYVGTVLHIYADRGDEEMVKFLLSKGADPNANSNINRTPLTEALRKGRTNIVKLLIDAGADVKSSHNGWTALHDAATQDNVTTIELLLGYGLNINARDADGITALHVAVHSDNIEVVKYLLTKGAEINTKDNQRSTPLHYAYSEEMRSLLLSKGAVIDNIHDAVSLGKIDIVRKMIEKYPNLVNDKRKEHIENLYFDLYTPLHRAIYEQQIEVARFLISKGADVNASAREGISPLICAVKYGNENLIRLLLEHGANDDQQDEEKRAPLHHAIIQKNVPVIKLLLEAGSDVNLKGCNGRTPLHYVILQLRSPKVAKLLIQNGAKVNIEDDYGRTPLDDAIQRKAEEIADLLRKHGAKTSESIR